MADINLFEQRQIRSEWNEKEQKWFFAIVDVIAILTDSPNPQVYWRVLKKRLKEEGNETVTNCNALKMQAADGRMHLTDVADVNQLLRLIQSIPSPKAEPFKLWLAKVGQERLEEIENPELTQHRMREIYKAKGYSDEWIEKRIRGIAVRDELTGEWKKRGVKEGLEYAILTSEISKATFGLTPSDYKKFKGLTKQQDNLRDYITDLELIFTMLGSASTTEIAKNKNALGFDQNKYAAIEGGSVAGRARKDLDRKSGRKVVTNKNYKSFQLKSEQPQPETEKQKRRIEKRKNK